MWDAINGLLIWTLGSSDQNAFRLGHVTLVELAGELDADTSKFAEILDAPETQIKLEREIEAVRIMDSRRFPSLVLDLDGNRWRVPVDYLNAGTMLETIALVT